jgi:hypothetical protein
MLSWRYIPAAKFRVRRNNCVAWVCVSRGTQQSTSGCSIGDPWLAMFE